MDMSRASACTYALHDRDLETALRVIAEAGFAKVDLWGRAPHFSTKVQEVKPRDIERKAAKYGVKVANLGSYPGRLFLDADRDVRHAEMNELTRTVDLAVRFGARSIRVSPGIGVSPQIAEALVDPFSRAAVYAASKGIYMGMENHAGSVAGVPELAAKLAQGVESRYFGVIYEPCNLLHCGVDYKAAFEVMKDFIVHVHLKDGKHTGDGFVCCHPGEGEVDLPWVLEALEGIGYSGDYAIEYEAWEIEPVETGLKRWYEHFAQL